MIRVTVKTQGHLLDDLVAYTESFQESVNATLVEVAREVEPLALDELGVIPPKRDPAQALDWTSEAQRIGFMASAGFGGGIPHERTNAIPNGWIVDVSTPGRAVIANNVPGSLYVYGSLARSNPGKWQQRYLAAIGWQTAYKTVWFWTDAIVEETLRRIDAQFKGIGSSVTTRQRAYTRR